MNIGERIKILRKEKNWNQTELGEKIGLGDKAVSSIEKGRNAPSAELIIKLSEIFEVSTDYLLKGVEPERRISESEQEILDVLREDKAMTNAVMEFAKVKKKAISYLGSYSVANQNTVLG
jgi:transcriptional regulator with XRE-family HTH domain